MADRSSMSIVQDRVPREILGQIFLSCLPYRPIDYLQPDLKVSPMNLCHICSYWRNVALGTPRLWNSLYHISYASEEVEIKDVFRYGIRPIDIEFLRWWAMNIGPLPPTLHLCIERRDVIGLHRSETDVAESNHKFVLDLLASARCLALGQTMRNALIHNAYPLLFQNLQSLLFFDQLLTLEGIYLSELCTHPDQIYNQLYIEGLFMKDSNFGKELPWTYLTHVCIDMTVTLPTWIHFMKKLSNLQCGIFQLHFQGGALPILSDTTLPHLRRLSINMGEREPGFRASLFKGLTFPALTGLRLSTSYFSPNHLSIEQLHELLRSTPALTELHILCEFPSSSDPDDEEEITPFPAGVDPLSLIIPNLEFLAIEIYQPEFLYREWREKLINSSWLNLKSKHNRIKTVLFFLKPQLRYNHILHSIRTHLAELQIDGVDLHILPFSKISPHDFFSFRFCLKQTFMHRDKMSFFLEHATPNS